MSIACRDCLRPVKRPVSGQYVNTVFLKFKLLIICETNCIEIVSHDKIFSLVWAAVFSGAHKPNGLL